MGKNVKNKYQSMLNICPYCRHRKTSNERFCMYCNLDFSDLEDRKLKEVSAHKKGKKLLYSYEGEIVYTPLIPSDISSSTMKMLTIVLGLFGIHNFYAGRIWRGLITLFFGILMIVAFYLFIKFDQAETFNFTIIFIYCAFLCMPFWFIDAFAVASKKFKYPVVLKTPIDVDKIYNAGKGKRR